VGRRSTLTLNVEFECALAACGSARQQAHRGGLTGDGADPARTDGIVTVRGAAHRQAARPICLMFYWRSFSR
jgi:hypothetical protein